MYKWFHKHFIHSKELANGKPHLKHSIFSLRILKLQCDTVAKGAAVGILVAFIPLPIQTVLAIILSSIIKGNVVIAIALTWVSNPFTFIPIVYLIYKVGNLVLGTNENVEPPPDIHIRFDSFSAFFSSSYEQFAHFGKAYFVGLPITAISFAILGYICIILIWKTSALFRK